MPAAEVINFTEISDGSHRGTGGGGGKATNIFIPKNSIWGPKGQYVATGVHTLLVSVYY